MSFDRCICSWNHHHNQDPEHSRYPKSSVVPFAVHHFLYPWRRKPLISFLPLEGSWYITSFSSADNPMKQPLPTFYRFEEQAWKEGPPCHSQTPTFDSSTEEASVLHRLNERQGRKLSNCWWPCGCQGSWKSVTTLVEPGYKSGQVSRPLAASVYSCAHEDHSSTWFIGLPWALHEIIHIEGLRSAQWTSQEPVNREAAFIHSLTHAFLQLVYIECPLSASTAPCSGGTKGSTKALLEPTLNDQSMLAIVGLPWGQSGWESACKCRGHGFEPWPRKIPQAAEQLSPCATTTEPPCHNYWSPRT